MRTLVDVNRMREVIARIAVDGGEIIVLDGLRPLRRDVLIKTAAAGDVDRLDAATDAEDLLVRGQRPADQQQFWPDAGRVGVVAEIVARLAIVGRIDVD